MNMLLKGAGVAAVTVALMATAFIRMINPADIKARPTSGEVATSLPSSGKTKDSDDWRNGKLGENGAKPSSQDLPLLAADEASAKIREMQRDLIALRKEVKHQRVELDALRHPEPDYASSDDVAVEAEEEYRHELENQRTADHVYQIDDTFLAESNDPNWSSEAELAVDTAVSSLRTKATDILSLECRTSMCRLEVAYWEQSAQIKFEAALPTELAEITPGMTIDSDLTDDGNISSVIYLVRAGYDLP